MWENTAKARSFQQETAPAKSSNTPLQRKKQLHRNSIEKTNKAINSFRGPRFLRGMVEKHSVNQRCCFHKSWSRAGGLGEFCFSPFLFVSSMSQTICIAIFVWQGVYIQQPLWVTEYKAELVSHETFYKILKISKKCDSLNKNVALCQIQRYLKKLQSQSWNNTPWD